MTYKYPKLIAFIFSFQILLISSCATRFTVKTPDFKDCTNSESFDDLQLSHLQSGYLESSPKRFQNKAKRAELWFTPVCINNNSGDTITLSKETVLVFSENLPVEPVADNRFIYKKLKQRPGWYALYILGGPWYVTNDEFRYYPIVPLFGVYNFVKAKNANARLKSEFIEKNVIGKKVAPYSSLDGWLSFRSTKPGNLYIRFQDNERE